MHPIPLTHKPSFTITMSLSIYRIVNPNKERRTSGNTRRNCQEQKNLEILPDRNIRYTCNIKMNDKHY